MRLFKHLRFSIFVVTFIFLVSALIGHLYRAGQERLPLLQALLDRTDILLHQSSPEQPQAGRDFIPVEQDAKSGDAQGGEASAPLISGTIRRGESIDVSLRRQSVSTEMRLAIIAALKSQLDFKRIKPQDTYTLQLDRNGELENFSYQSGPLTVLNVKNSDNGYQASRAPIELERREVKISGEIKSSLFAAFADQNEDMRLVYAFADVFASKIDFNTEIKPGDRFSLVVDKYYKNGVLVGYGKVEAAQYRRVNGQVLEGYLFHTASGKDVYYDQNGEGVGTSFLRSPVPVGKLTSKFSYHRRHPITGQIRPHLGVDLAAPIGTPIMAAADGRVVEIGPNKGFGNQVIIAHSGDYKTYYAHLSRFRPGLHPGSLVTKKEVIGYVGESGEATGPHLDYRVQHHTVFLDPFATTFKTQDVLAGRDLARFRQEVRGLATLADMQEFTPETQVLKVSNLTLTKEHSITTL